MDDTGSVKTAEELADVVNAIARDWETDGRAWQNQTAGAFVEALAAWLTDMQGYYANRGTTVAAQSPWQVMADAVSAARYYE